MACAITSLPVPVSPCTSTAESTGATLLICSSTVWNFMLDPIKSKLAIALLLASRSIEREDLKRVEVLSSRWPIVERSHKANNPRWSRLLTTSGRQATYHELGNMPCWDKQEPLKRGKLTQTSA